MIFFGIIHRWNGENKFQWDNALGRLDLENMAGSAHQVEMDGMTAALPRHCCRYAQNQLDGVRREHSCLPVTVHTFDALFDAHKLDEKIYSNSTTTKNCIIFWLFKTEKCRCRFTRHHEPQNNNTKNNGKTKMKDEASYHPSSMFMVIEVVRAMLRDAYE